MTPDQVLERLRLVLKNDLGVTTEVALESHLRVDLGLDSLALTDLAFLVRQDFALDAVGPDALRGVTTVGQLVDVIVRHGG